METSVIHIELIRRKQKLEQIRLLLKEKFLGLDEIIDEVIATMMPWYLFPDAQLRPTIVNLWGLTGSGKTALIQTIVKLLDYSKYYSHIDMGEFESDSASWLKEILTGDLEFFHEKSVIICLDEFQFARTIDGQGAELGKDKLRVLWDLLDSGKIEYIPNNSTYYLFRAESCLRRFAQLNPCEVVIRDGIIVDGLDKFEKAFDGFYFEYNNTDVKKDASYFLSVDFVNGVFSLFDEETFSRDAIRARIKSSTLEEIVLMVNQGLQSIPATKVLDLSRAIVFILGNLDEAYPMSHDMNPDISADEFHEATSRITIADIKKALRKRFRAEQIARLGNNHIVYKSFNNAQFRMLIKQGLKTIGDFVTNRFGWQVTFDESVVDIVYAEGVFPAQGTRPVLTTIKNLIESRIANLVVNVLEYQLPIAGIEWTFGNGEFTYSGKDANGNVILTFSEKAKLKVDSLRKSVDPEIQAHTAVHEAGHAVLAALTFRIIPSVVVSRTASDMEGFCLLNFPKGPMTRDTLRMDIVVTLGGYVAEKMIFGENHTSAGVHSDIETASALANRAVRQYAMGKDPVFLAVETNEDAFFVKSKHCEEAVAIIRRCECEAEQILERNKLLLLKMAEYLTHHSRMEQAMIESFVTEFGVDDWIRKEGFVKPEHYFRFNQTLKEQIGKLREAQAMETEIERLVSSLETLA